MTVGEMARKYGVSYDSVLWRVKSGAIPARKQGHHWVVPDDATLPGIENIPKIDGMDTKTEETKRREYIYDLKRNAVTRQEKNRAFIMWNEYRYTVQEIAARLRLTSREVMQIYDEELAKMERVIGN